MNPLLLTYGGARNPFGGSFTFEQVDRLPPNLRARFSPSGAPVDVAVPASPDDSACRADLRAERLGNAVATPHYIIAGALFGGVVGYLIGRGT